MKMFSEAQFAEVQAKASSFILGADHADLKAVLPGEGNSPAFSMFPICVPVPAGTRRFWVRAGEEGGAPVSMCFSKILFAGWEPGNKKLADLAEYATCEQSSCYFGKDKPANVVSTQPHLNVLHTRKEDNPSWSASFPEEVTVKYIYFYRRADRHVVADKNIRIEAEGPDGERITLYQPGVQREWVEASFLAGLAALKNMRGMLGDAGVPAFDQLVGAALEDLCALMDGKVEKADVTVKREQLCDTLLTAAYLALGEARDFGITESSGLHIDCSRRSFRHMRFRAFGELPPGLGGASFWKKGGKTPIKTIKRDALKFKAMRSPLAFPDHFSAGLTTKVRARQVDLGEELSPDHMVLWNINRQHAANTLFTEVSVRSDEDEEWQVIYDHGAIYREAVALLRFIELFVRTSWSPAYGRFIGKLLTQFRRRAVMRAAARFCRKDEAATKAVFKGSAEIAKQTRHCSPLRLTKHGLGVPIAYRDTKTVLGHMVQMRDTLRDLGYTPLLMYGTLLGAIREKDFIPHDDDVDLAIIVDVDELSQTGEACDALVLQLQEAGMKANRANVICPLIHCHQGPITYDIFILGRIGDTVHWPHARLKVVPERADIFFPTKTIEFKGEVFDAPHDPEAVCEARYGSGWRVPDPSFEW